MLGMAIEGVGDRVTIECTETDGIRVAEIQGVAGVDVERIPIAWQENTAAVAAKALWDAADGQGGLQLSILKGIPLKSGMGGSAASAVAAVVAANELLDKPLPRDRLLEFALEGEKVASQAGHADNIAPSLLGGLVFCPMTLLPDTVLLPMPKHLRCVVLHPSIEISTADSRRSLSTTVAMEAWLEQQAIAISFVLGCLRDDVELIGRNLRDLVIEPQRAASIPCFEAVKSAACEAGAFGCSISGSGPAIFALATNEKARDVEKAMRDACEMSGLGCRAWVSAVNAAGAKVVSG